MRSSEGAASRAWQSVQKVSRVAWEDPPAEKSSKVLPAFGAQASEATNTVSRAGGTEVLEETGATVGATPAVQPEFRRGRERNHTEDAGRRE